MKNIIKDFAFSLVTLLMCLSQGCTTNPGWVSQVSGTTDYLPGVWFTDANKGTVVGVGDTILRTTNEGETWTSQTIITGEELRGVSFSGSMNGWAVGIKGTILHKTTECERC